MRWLGTLKSPTASHRLKSLRTPSMPTKPPANLDHVWHTPGLTTAEAEQRQRENLASLRRKITYCLNRSGEPLHYQRVEGWSARQVLELMEEKGISRVRIERDFSRRGSSQ